MNYLTNPTFVMFKNRRVGSSYDKMMPNEIEAKKYAKEIGKVIGYKTIPKYKLLSVPDKGD